VIVTRVVHLADGEELVSYQADVPDSFDSREARLRMAGPKEGEALEGQGDEKRAKPVSQAGAPAPRRFSSPI
jgi:hypothetical protein